MMKPFEIRGFNPCESLLRHTPEQLRRFIRRMKKLNMNTIIIHYDYGWKRYRDLILEECRAAGVNIILMTFGPRTFLSYSDWKHSYFAKNTNGEPFTKRLECETYPCCFEPEALAAYAYGARQWLKELPPEIKHVHMRAADGLMFCQCPKCRALPQNEKWQPFVDIFTQAVLEVRSDLKFETDVYVKRYRIPEKAQAFQQMTNIMYDTFYRKPTHTLANCTFPDPELAKEAADAILEKEVDADSANTYHFKRLQEWSRAFPQKVYVHENAMIQGSFGVFQHGTWSYLQDLETFRKLGLQGVCYEAYEPGYSNFEEMFEILAKALNGEEVNYQPTETELLLRSQSGEFVGCDFPAEKYLTDPVKLKHALYYRDFIRNPDAKAYRALLTLALENEDVLDPLFIGFRGATYGMAEGKLTFDRKQLSPAAADLLSRRKLWDFMEEIPLNEDPYKICRDLMTELLCKAL